MVNHGKEKVRFLFSICSSTAAAFPELGEPEPDLPVVHQLLAGWPPVDHEAGPRQFLHLAANLVHLALHCTSLESAEALHFPPSAAVTIPAFAAQQPPLPGTTEQRERMHNYQLRWNFRHETSRAEEQQVSRGELWWQHKEQGRGAATARGEQQHRRREAGARTEQQHRRREAAARTEQQQQHKQGRSWRISSTGGGGSRCGGCSNSRRGGSSRSRSKSSRLRRTRELEEDELHRIVAGGPGDARGDHDGGAIPGRRS